MKLYVEVKEIDEVLFRHAYLETGFDAT